VSTKAGGVLAIWHDLTPQGEAEVNDWYNHEHHRERVSVSGFFSARRHVALRGAPKYFIFYETESPDVLTSRAYLDRLNNPTAWTRRSMRHFRNNSRSVCHAHGAFGAGHGGVVATLRLSPDDRARETGRAKILARLRQAVDESGIVTARLWEVDRDKTAAPSAEKRLRGEADNVADWIVILSGNHPEQVDTARIRHLSTEVLVDAGIGPDASEVGLYRLIFTLGG
jgi:hypothetical protein